MRQTKASRRRFGLSGVDAWLWWHVGNDDELDLRTVVAGEASANDRCRHGLLQS